MTGQSVAGRHITGLHVILAAEHGLDLKLEVELEVVQGVNFCRQAEDALHPGIAGLKDLGVLAVLQDAVDEGQHGNHPTLLVGFIQQTLQVQVLMADDLVLFDGEVAQPVSQVLQQGPLTSLHVRMTQFNACRTMRHRKVADSLVGQCQMSHGNQVLYMFEGV